MSGTCQAIQEKAFEIMSLVFKVPLEEIGEESSPDSIGSWDSMKHINLILAFEEEFNIEIDEEETLEMISSKSILNLLGQKLNSE